QSFHASNARCMARIRFLTDEHVPKAVAKGLRQPGCTFMPALRPERRELRNNLLTGSDDKTPLEPSADASRSSAIGVRSRRAARLLFSHRIHENSATVAAKRARRLGRGQAMPSRRRSDSE